MLLGRRRRDATPAAVARRFGGGFDDRVADCHQSDLAGSAAPIARSGHRRGWSSLAATVRWTAESVRRSCDEEPLVAGTHFLDDDRGSLRSDDEDAARLDCVTVIVGWDLRKPSLLCARDRSRLRTCVR